MWLMRDVPSSSLLLGFNVFLLLTTRCPSLPIFKYHFMSDVKCRASSLHHLITHKSIGFFCS